MQKVKFVLNHLNNPKVDHFEIREGTIIENLRFEHKNYELYAYPLQGCIKTSFGTKVLHWTKSGHIKIPSISCPSMACESPYDIVTVLKDYDLNKVDPTQKKNTAIEPNNQYFTKLYRVVRKNQDNSESTTLFQGTENECECIIEGFALSRKFNVSENDYIIIEEAPRIQTKEVKYFANHIEIDNKKYYNIENIHNIIDNFYQNKQY